MKKAKYIELFNSLTEKEKKEFGKFINSPFNNESKRLAAMYDYLRKETQKQIKNISIEPVLVQLFPNHKPSDDDIRKIYSDFSIMIEEFLTVKSLRKHDFQKRYFLLKELRHRSLDTIFESKLKEQKVLLDNYKLRNREYYLDRVKFLFEEYFYLHSRNEIKKASETSAEIDGVTDSMYMTLKLNVFINDRFDGSSGNKGKKELIKIVTILKFVKTRLNLIIREEPRLYVYYLLAKLLYSGGNSSSVLHINKYIRANKELLNPDILDYFRNVLFRFCISRMNEGKYEFSNIAFGILEEMENDGMFDRVWEIPCMTFFNTVTFTIYRKEITLAEKFVNKYYQKLNPEVRNETCNVCMVLISFAKKNYSDVKKYSVNLKTKNLYYYLFAKTALLKTYYESGDFKYIHSLADTIEHYIRRKKEMNDLMKRSVIKFLSYVQKLTRAKKDGGKYVNTLADILADEGTFFQSNWVKQKINELEGKI